MPDCDAKLAVPAAAPALGLLPALGVVPEVADPGLGPGVGPGLRRTALATGFPCIGVA